MNPDRCSLIVMFSSTFCRIFSILSSFITNQLFISESKLSDDESDEEEEEEAPVAKKKRKTISKVKAAVKDKVVKKKTTTKKGILTKRGPSTPTTDPEESADEALAENKTSVYAGGTGTNNYGGGDWRSLCAVDW